MSGETSTKSVLALVFGILSWVACPCLGGVLAVIFGAGEKSDVGRVGFWLGAINLAFTLLWILAAAAFLMVAAVAEAAH